jgi:hypothetical protein
MIAAKLAKLKHGEVGNGRKVDAQSCTSTEEAANQEEAPRNPNGRKGESRVDNVNSTKGGNDTTYALRRLARDNPALLDKIEAGELSVNQAAIQAGIRKKPQPSEP